MPRQSRAPEPWIQLRTADGRLLSVRDGRIAGAPASNGFSIDLGPGELRPGLINAHDHLFLNHFPRLGRPPYPNVYAWAEDVQNRFADEVRRYRSLPLRDALLFGALKNLIGGATAVVYHDTWSREAESLPIRVLRVRVLHSLGLERDLAAARRGDATTRERPLCMHLAEGTDARAAAEVQQAAASGLLGADALLVHMIAVDSAGVALTRESGAAVVWCPSSNLHLYGRTLARELAGSGVDVLLGTDSLLSGAGTLLDELKLARECRLLDDDALTRAVGTTAARRLRVPLPSLEPGASADLILLRRPLLEARPADVGLVMVAGRPCYGDAEFAELFERSGVAVEELVVGGTRKLVAAPLGTIAQRVLDLSPSCTRIFEA